MPGGREAARSNDDGHSTRAERRIERSILALILLTPLVSWGAETPAPQDVPPSDELLAEPVVVTEEKLDQRQRETAAKIVIQRDDLNKFNDKTLTDALKRVPGVTVDDEIRIRGLGARYAQVLIDGEPAPPGFSLDSIPVEMIEYIEVYRTAVAQFSTQSIAGTINIVMHKDAGRMVQREATLSIARNQSRWSPAASINMSGGGEQFSYQLAANASRVRKARSSQITSLLYDDAGVVTADRRTFSPYEEETTTYNVSPQLDWKLGRNSIHWLTYIERYDNPNRWRTSERDFVGGPTQYPIGELGYDYSRADSQRTEVKWSREAAGVKQGEAKLSVNNRERDSRFLFSGFDSARAFRLRRDVVSDVDDLTLRLTGKYVIARGEKHAINAGWDLADIERDEGRHQTDVTAAGDTVFDLDQSYSARVRQTAFYLQDEWMVADRLQMYLGLRWEGLDTRVTGEDFQAVTNSASVISPIVQSVWQLPGREKDQIRVGISRTYKAPATVDLVPRRFIVDNDNSPTNADYQGNPDLRPELAWGLDIAYESYFGKKGFAGVSLYGRRVSAVITQSLLLDEQGWVSTFGNNGSAEVYGIEVELKAPLRTFLPDAPDIDLVANASRNWSHVSNTPGPNNRLASQIPFSANLGFDWRASTSLAIGSNLSYTGTALTRLTDAWLINVGPIRKVDLYAKWSFDSRLAVRAAVANVLHQDRDYWERYTSAGTNDLRRTVTTSGVTTDLSLTYKF